MGEKIGMPNLEQKDNEEKSLKEKEKALSELQIKINEVIASGEVDKLRPLQKERENIRKEITSILEADK